MARRHPALIPLTHDHHHGLVRARRLRIVASSDDARERLEEAREFVDFYDRETVVHFREEEEVVFPRLIGAFDEPPELLIRILVEHLRIHHLVGSLQREIDAGEVSPDTMSKVGHLVESHIRTEERELFPLIEEGVAPEEMDRVRLRRPRDPG